MTSHHDNWISDALEDATERAQRAIALQEMATLSEQTGGYDDPVKPNHYNVGGIETIDFIRAKLTKEEYKGYCKGNVIKYLSRADYKGGLEDFKKAEVYMQWLVANEEKK